MNVAAMMTNKKPTKLQFFTSGETSCALIGCFGDMLGFDWLYGKRSRLNDHIDLYGCYSKNAKVL